MTLLHGPIIKPLPSPLTSCFLDVAGIKFDGCGQSTDIRLCVSCFGSASCGKTPPLSLLNNTFLGAVPPQLKDLTFIEEVMIAHCRAKV